MLWNVAIPSRDWVFLRLPKSWLFFFRGLGGSGLFGLIAFWYDGHIGRWSINCHGMNLPDQSNFIDCLKFLRYYHCLSVDGALHRSFETQWFRHLSTLVVEECLGMKMPTERINNRVWRRFVWSQTRHAIPLTHWHAAWMCIPLIFGVLFVLVLSHLSSYPCIRCI